MSQLSSEKNKRKLKIAGGVSVLLLGALYYYKYYYNNRTSCCDKNASKVKSTCCDTNTAKSCCNMEQKSNKISANMTKEKINERYSATARNEYTQSEQDKLQSIAKVFGYSVDELAEIGNEANLGLSCGNPVKQANLKKGETVLDLGCGAGMDLFLAKKYIGDSSDGGQLLGVDFSKDMIAKANRNAQKKHERKGTDISNMKFMNAEIENMSEIKENSVDCVISNCVINLVPNKLNAFTEVYRVLKANGGRICLSDIALKKELPQTLKNDITSIVNCVGGAIAVKEYEELLYKAGFKNVKLVNKNVDLNVWKENWESMVGCCESKESTSNSKQSNSSGCCGGNNDKKQLNEKQKQTIQQLLDETNMNDYIASYYVFAFK